MYTSQLNFYITKIDMERKQAYRVRLEKCKILEVQGHCHYKRYAKGTTALPQYCSFHTFLLSITHALGASAKAVI